MTKRDYQLIADTVEDTAEETHETMCKNFEENLRKENINFDTTQFRNACMGDE